MTANHIRFLLRTLISSQMRLNPRSQFLKTAGDILAKAGRYEEAFLCWDKAYELDPSDIACLFSKAETLAGIGETEQAIAEFENILRWLEKHEYNLDIEGVYPRRRMEELRHSR